jgi:amino acid adenylation domain-containing protein
MNTLKNKILFEEVEFDPFAPVVQFIPSTEPQREIFMSVKLGGKEASCAYNESVSMYFHGSLNHALFQESFQRVIKRHNALRALFSEDGTKFRIVENLIIPFDITDISSQTDEQQIAYCNALKNRETTIEFDLEKGPLIRCSLIKLNETKNLFVLTAHHIICDGWSLSLLLQDLGKIYSALVEGKEPELEPAASFVDYALNEEKYQKSIACAGVEAFWLNQFDEEPPQVDFPADKKRPTFRTFNANRIEVPVPPALVNDLRELAKKTKTSFVTLMLSIYETFLYKVTGQKELVVGLPAAGQNIDGLFNLVGHCVNLLPLHTHISPEKSFLDYLQERRKYMFDAFDNQQLTFGSLVGKLNITRDLSRIPLVPVVFNVDIGFTEGFYFNGLTFEFIINPRKYENFEVFLNASGSGEKLVLECTYNTDLFKEEMMELRMQEFIVVMNEVVKESNKQIANISVMTETEQGLVKALNATTKPYPSKKGVHELFAEIASQYPDRIAISSSNTSYTYKDTDKHVNNIAAQLQQRGIKHGDFVGVYLPRLVELPMVLLAIMKCGAAYVPLDPNFPTDRILMMLEDSEAPLIITTDSLKNQLGLPQERLFVFKPEELPSLPQMLFTNVPVIKDQLAYILYTSGSTGKPKGVMIKHHSVINEMYDLRDIFNVKPEDTLLAITTISFDISVLEFFMPLLSGARIHLATREQAMDGKWLEETIHNLPITFLQGTPATWELMLTSGWKGAKHLNVLCGGEALRIELALKLVEKNKSVWNLYGPTETTVWSTAKLVTADDFINTRNGGISIGKPLANTLLYVVDEFGNPCALGVAGELWIGGVGVAEGYLKRPDLNKEKFIENPFAEGMLYRTGDRVTVDLESNLHFLNRLDHQVKVRGFRIELGEIEAALNKCPGIHQGVVIARQSAIGETFLAAYFLADTNVAGVPKEELQKQLISSARESMSKLLPDYMMPSAWMLLDKFPLTPNDKIDRKALPDPQPSRATESKNSSNEVFSKTEKIIADVWKQILNLNDINLDDDFFFLGGHSLLAVRMMVDLEHITGMKLPLAVLFTNPTVRALSKLYDTPQKDEIWNSLVTIKESGSRNPLYFAHGISGNVFKYHDLAHMLNAEQPSYGLQALGLNGKDEPLSVMEDIAAYHINEILKFQPEGPYAIAGGSFGGYLAYEIACQLRAMNKEVNFLCLFDLEAASELDFLPQGVKQVKGAQLFAERIMKRAVTFISADKEERQKYIQAKLKNKPVKASNQDYDLESWLDKHEMVELIGEESASYFRFVEEACYKAMVNYKIKKYDRDITVIRAQEGYFNNTYAHDLGWKHFTSGKVNVHVVQGDHNSIFWEPNVIHLAKTVDTALNKIY